MNLRKPTAAAVADQQQLLTILLGFYDALIELSKPLQPGRSPNLKSVTLSTFAALRATVGDINGELGPRLALVAGNTAILDAGKGVFAWDSTSQLADDNANVLQVTGVATGRWRRAL